MICINKKKNLKLLQNFNNDPFADIAIKTQTNLFHLVLSYLAIDSEYFNRVAPDTEEINLQQLPEKSLIRVLKSLYGDELYAFNISQLVELYGIINYLEINDYKTNIQENILEDKELMNSLQLMEFSFNHGILKEQLKDHHFKHKLETLSDSRNYLQLNKISQSNINSLLIGYSERYGNAADQTINYILENYFGRNQISSFQYFRNPAVEPLRRIWQKYHHSISYVDQCRNNQEKVKQSQIITANLTDKPKYNFGTNSVNNIYPVSQQIMEKDQEIEQLKKTLELKEQIITSLREQIEKAKMKNQIEFGEDDEKEMLEGVMRSKKQRQNYLSGEFQISMIQPAFDKARKITNDQKQVKTMNRLNSRSKKIFQ